MTTHHTSLRSAVFCLPSRTFSRAKNTTWLNKENRGSNRVMGGDPGKSIITLYDCEGLVLISHDICPGQYLRIFCCIDLRFTSSRTVKSKNLFWDTLIFLFYLILTKRKTTRAGCVLWRTQITAENVHWLIWKLFGHLYTWNIWIGSRKISYCTKPSS